MILVKHKFSFSLKRHGIPFNYLTLKVSHPLAFFLGVLEDSLHVVIFLRLSNDKFEPNDLAELSLKNYKLFFADSSYFGK